MDSPVAVTTYLLQNGGTVSSVAKMLFWKAITFGELLGLQYEDCENAVQSILPSCRNDREFGFVSGMCGYERVSRPVLKR
jgi:hypothetical protein